MDTKHCQCGKKLAKTNDGKLPFESAPGTQVYLLVKKKLRTLSPDKLKKCWVKPVLILPDWSDYPDEFPAFSHNKNILLHDSKAAVPGKNVSVSEPRRPWTGESLEDGFWGVPVHEDLPIHVSTGRRRCGGGRKGRCSWLPSRQCRKKPVR